jgi:hypothetical protein
MPLSDEEQVEVKELLRERRESKVRGERWRTSLLVGVGVMPIAATFFVLIFGFPTGLGWVRLLMFAIAIGYLTIFAVRAII